MNAAMALSPAQWDEVNAALSGMDAKTGVAFMKLCGYLRRFGTIPSADRALASILGVSVAFLRNRAWPLLESWLESTPDGKRYLMPEITGVRSQRAHEPEKPAKASQQQEAANIRHARERAQKERERLAAAAQADASKPHAETHAFPMRDASETHAETHPVDAPNASSDASDASPLVRPNSLSLREDSLDQPIEKERVLERESSRAGAPEAAPADAVAHARTHKSDAPAHAEAHAEGVRPIQPNVRPIRPVKLPIAPDWRPDDELMARALLIRADADAQVQKYIDFNTGNGKEASDWGALFPRFLEHANEHDARRGIPTTAPIVGSEPKTVPILEIDEPITGTGPEADWARVRQKLGKGVVRNWFGKAVLVGVEDGEAMISLPTLFIRDHIATKYGSLVTTFWTELNPDIRRVEFVVAEAERRTADG